MVGRESELGAVAKLLGGVDEGPAVLVLRGEAGIGKSTVWQAGVEAAYEQGFAVWACRPAATEIHLSYQGLTDLVAGLDDELFESLPTPQRRALDAALLRTVEEEAGPDQRPIAAGLLSLLNALAAAGPLLVAIDDLQWLDEPSRQVVQFAVRRCAGPVAVVATLRDESRREAATSAEVPVELQQRAATGLRPRDPDRVSALKIGPLSLAALRELIRRHTGKRLARPAMVRIAEISGGNPFFALELARIVDPAASGVTQLPDSLKDLVSDRLLRLDPPVRVALTVASALAAPRIDLIERALDEGGAIALLGQAEDAGVVDLAPDGTVGFRHPLLAAAAYAETSPTARRRLHRKLATVVEDVEERARHLALAAVGADPETLAALDAAAAQAHRRGAPANAAELLELAIGLGSDDPSRLVQAGRAHFDIGGADRARELLEAAVDELDPGPTRAEALALLGTIGFEAGADEEAIRLLEQAFDEAAGDPRLRCGIALELGYVLVNSGSPHDGYSIVLSGLKDAEALDDDGLLAESLAARAIVTFMIGEGVDDHALSRALALEDPDRRSLANLWPTLLAGFVYYWSHRLDEARQLFEAARKRCLDHGAESEVWMVSICAVPAACAAGDLEAAERIANELVGLAQTVESNQARAAAWGIQAELWSWTGRVDEARAAGNEAMSLFDRGGARTFALWTLGAVGRADLSVGNHGAAAERLGGAATMLTAMGLAEPAAFPFLPDGGEALVLAGRPDEAEPVVALLEASGRKSDRAWAQAVGARCRALLLATQGHPHEASAAFQKALDAHDRLPQLRYDRARTLLLYGQHQRRSNQRIASRASLHEAAHLFDEVGAAQWARNARKELERLGLEPKSGDQLTPTEERVAELAATGMTVREVAAVLIVSPKTVEAHLTRIYRKLGIRSRAELGRRMAERPGPPQD